MAGFLANGSTVGAPGPAGSSFVWRGEWESGDAYEQDDVVSFGGSLYIALADNSDVEPGTDPDTWDFMLSGAADAYGVAYTNPGYPGIGNVGQALDTILYVPMDITAFAGGGTFEIGSSVASVNLTWSLNKDPTTQSINNGVGGQDPEDRAVTVNGPFTSDITWTLTASDGETEDTAQTGLAFRHKRYWGVSASTTLNNAAILALSNEFATGRQKSISYNATGGRYPYYVYPVSFGAPANVTVGGLAFSDYTVSTQSFTNASGHTADFYVIRFNNIQTGAAINVVWN
jgi:hypothetical protein